MRTSLLCRRAIAPVAVAVAGASLLVAPLSSTSPAAQSPQIQAFQLRAAHSGKNVDVASGSEANGAAVVQNAANANNSQGWIPLPFGTGWIMVNANSLK